MQDTFSIVFSFVEKTLRSEDLFPFGGLASRVYLPMSIPFPFFFHEKKRTKNRMWEECLSNIPFPSYILPSSFPYGKVFLPLSLPPSHILPLREGIPFPMEKEGEGIPFINERKGKDGNERKQKDVNGRRERQRVKKRICMEENFLVFWRGKEKMKKISYASTKTYQISKIYERTHRRETQ